MAKVLFSITDAQLACLNQLRSGVALPDDADKRTLTGLIHRKLIETGASGNGHTLTDKGAAVVALCEMLAIPSGKFASKRKP